MDHSNELEVRKWLLSESKEANCAFATRDALRALPMLILESKEHRDSFLLPSLRSIILGAVFSQSNGESDHELLERAANTAMFTVVDSVAVGASTVASCVAAKKYDAEDYAALAAFSASIYESMSQSSSMFAKQNDGDQIRLGSLDRIFRQELWYDAKRTPAKPIQDLDTLWDGFLLHDSSFDFWRRWYFGMRRGEPLDWELQHRVALIPDTVWEKGAEAVAEAISAIEAELFNTANSETPPEPVQPSETSPLFDQAPIIAASMAAFSEVIELRVDAFTRMERPNELIPFFETYRSLPQTAQRISAIVDQGPKVEGSEQALAIEVGRLRAQVAQLEAELATALKDLENLRKKPWFKKASVLLPSTVISAIAVGVWSLSGDDKSLEQRWNKLVTDLEFVSAKLWPEPEDRMDEPLRFELPDISDA